MRSLLFNLLLLVLGVSCVSAGVPFSRGVSSSSVSLFGIRGGGLFGGGKDDKKDADAGDRQIYPAMTQAEIEDWLEHIPCFAVTDSQGSGVVLRPDNDTSVFYFFMSPMQANATLQQLKGANDEMDLKVSAFSLGKIWFSLLQSGPETEVTLKAPGAEEGEKSQGVQYRLVPDTRDLLGARMLLTMTPEDGEKMKEEGMTAEVAQETLKKAMETSPKFNSTYNEIPVFTIAQMRMQKKQEEGETEPVTLLPMYFSLQNMVGTWQQFMSSASPDLQGVEPAINLMSLHELVALMQKESEVDWRNVVLVPGTPIAGPEGAGGPVAQAAPAGGDMASMGGATLGDI